MDFRLVKTVAGGDMYSVAGTPIIIPLYFDISCFLTQASSKSKEMELEPFETLDWLFENYVDVSRVIPNDLLSGDSLLH